MSLQRFLKRLAPTRPLARTPGYEFVGFKYTPHMLVAMIALVAWYWVMGWELP